MGGNREQRSLILLGLPLIEWMLTSSSSNRSAIVVINTRVLKKQNEINSSIEDLVAFKDLIETDTDVPHIVSPSKREAIEEKKLKNYKRTVRYIRSLDTRDPSKKH